MEQKPEFAPPIWTVDVWRDEDRVCYCSIEGNDVCDGEVVRSGHITDDAAHDRVSKDEYKNMCQAWERHSLNLSQAEHTKPLEHDLCEDKLFLNRYPEAGDIVNINSVMTVSHCITSTGTAYDVILPNKCFVCKRCIWSSGVCRGVSVGVVPRAATLVSSYDCIALRESEHRSFLLRCLKVLSQSPCNDQNFATTLVVRELMREIDSDKNIAKANIERARIDRASLQ